MKPEPHSDVATNRGLRRIPGGLSGVTLALQLPSPIAAHNSMILAAASFASRLSHISFSTCLVCCSADIAPVWWEAEHGEG